MEPNHARCCTCSLVQANRVTTTSGRALVMTPASPLCLDVRVAPVDGELLLLMPSMPESFDRTRIDDEVVARVDIRGCTDSLVRVVGWLSEVDENKSRALAIRFSERHVTADLLDIGNTWRLMRLDPAEGFLKDEVGETPLDPDQLRIVWSLH